MSLARGFFWTSLAVVVTKALSVGNQWILGFILEPADFGVFAIAIGSTVLISGFLDSGVAKLLVKEQHQLDYYFRRCVIISAGLGLASSFILIASTALQQEQEVRQVIWVLAAFIPFIAISHCFKSVLLIRLDFKRISHAEMLNAFIYGVILIGAALLGLKAFSFVIALGSSYLFFFLFYRYSAGKMVNQSMNSSQLASYGSVLSQLKWIILATFGMGMALRGDYLVIGRLVDTHAIGQYYFGFMTITNIGLMVAQGVNNVLMPNFTKLQQDPIRLRSQFEFLSFGLVAVTSILCLGFIYLGPDLIHFVWYEKWHEAIVISVLIALSFPLRMLSPMGSALLESMGLWRTRALLTWLDAITLVMAAAAGAYSFGILGAAVGVALQRGTFGLMLYLQAARQMQCPAFVGKLILYAAPFVLAVVVYYGVMSWWFQFTTMTALTGYNGLSLWQKLPLIALSFLVFVGLIWSLHKSYVTQLLQRLRQMPLVRNLLPT